MNIIIINLYSKVNNNGDISFDDPVPTYTPQEFPLDNFPLIAPFWADVDTRGTGMVWYRNASEETVAFPLSHNML